MKISTKGRYGLRLILDLALHGNTGVVTLKDVGKRQKISEKYLWQIASPLKAAGIVKATPGSRGGFNLARPLGTITLKDILDVLEGGGPIVDCVDNPESCSQSAECVARDIWTELNEKLTAATSSITLKDLLEKQKNKLAKNTENYFI